jgi:hypothetical protein
MSGILKSLGSRGAYKEAKRRVIEGFIDRANDFEY